MSREKFNCPWAIAACPLAIAAPAASALPARAASSTPSSRPARLTMPTRLELPMLRAMWRCVTCVSSWAMTDASSSGCVVIAIRPR